MSEGTYKSNGSNLEQRYITYEELGLNKAGQSLWVWGQNSFTGRLGIGIADYSFYPVTKLGSELQWKTVAAEPNAAYGIKLDGSLWVWGLSDLLNGNYSLTPVQYGDSYDWDYVVAGTQVGFAIKTNGTLWAWGRNPHGQLGLGDRVHRSSPTQIGGNNSWEYITVNRFGNNVRAIMNGNMYSWGFNSEGSLGIVNSPIHRSNPVQITTQNTWKLVKCGQYTNLAIKTDGTLWTWGSSDYNMGGLPIIFGGRSSPTQVGSSTDWKDIGCGYWVSLAIKTDGALWGVGYNYYDELPTIANGGSLTSFTQLGSSYDWNNLYSTSQIHYSIKNDGTLWEWGTYSLGASSSPTKIGTSTNWIFVSSSPGEYQGYSLGIQGSF